MSPNSSTPSPACWPAVNARRWSPSCAPVARRPSAWAPRCWSSRTARRWARLAAAATRTTPLGKARLVLAGGRAQLVQLRTQRRLRRGDRPHLRRADGSVHRARRPAARSLHRRRRARRVPPGEVRRRGRLPPARRRRPRGVRQRASVSPTPPKSSSTTSRRGSAPPRFRRGSHVVVVTRGHRHDLEARARRSRRASCAYLGLIGSRAKVARVFEALVRGGRRRPTAPPRARADRPRHRRCHARGNRHQHRRRADCRAPGTRITPRDGRAPMGPQALRWAPPAISRVGIARRRPRAAPSRPARLKREPSAARASRAACPPCPALLVRNATLLTMNDALDVIQGDLLSIDGRIVAVGAVDAAGGASRRARDRRRRRLVAAGLRPDPHPPVPDAVPRAGRRPAAARLAAPARLAARGRAHASDAAGGRATGRARTAAGGTTSVLTMETVHDTDAVHRGRRRHRPARHRRQVHDGRHDNADVPLRLQRADAGVDRREPGAAPALARRGRRPPARGPGAALRRVVLARPARGSRPRSRPARASLVHTHASESRAEVAYVRERSGPRQHGVPGRDWPGLAAPVRRALRLGRRGTSRR